MSSDPTKVLPHTPGPWKQQAPKIDGVVDAYRWIEAGNGMFPDPDGSNADLNPSGFKLSGFISEADARLIAAAPELLAACKAQHEAIDRLFAMLIGLTREHTPDAHFFPTKSGQPWGACQQGNAAIAKAEDRS